MRNLLALFAVVAAVFSPVESRAQFYKVYGYETLEQGEIEGVVWNSYVAEADGSFSFFGEQVSRNGLWAHSAEVEYGATDRLMLAARADFLDPPDESFKHIGSRAIFLRYRFGEPGGSFFDPAILLEYNLPRSSYSDSEKLEMRVILERSFGDVMLRLNPIVEKATSGSEVEEGLEFAYAAGIYYNGYDEFRPGLEVYGEAGKLSDLEPLKEQEIVVFPTLDFHVASLHWHIGVGFGITDESDDVTFKSILSYGF